MFQRFRKAQVPPDAARAHLEGKRLYDQAQALAEDFRIAEAMDLLNRSIAASPNPAPLISRAELLKWRLRHAEALADILEARKLDQQQGREFTALLDDTQMQLEALTFNHRNGMRDKLIADLADKGHQHVAKRILCTVFGLSEGAWNAYACPPLMEYHFFNDIDTILKFADPAHKADAEGYARHYPPGFLDHKLQRCPDAEGYALAELKIQSFLCCYPERDMRILRHHMLYDMNNAMLTRDHGQFSTHDDPKDGEITKEAAAFAKAAARAAAAPAGEKPAQMVAGILVRQTPEGAIDIELLIDQVVNRLQALCPTERDLYRFVMEESRRLSTGTAFEVEIAGRTGITGFEQERAAAQFGLSPEFRAALEFLGGKVSPDLAQLLGEGAAVKVRAVILLAFLRRHAQLIAPLRLKCAVHYHNSCLAKGRFDMADRWTEVIEALERA